MKDYGGKGTSKVYCTSCDQTFASREQYERHLAISHSYERAKGNDISCESCPLDSAISKLIGLFRRK